LEDFISPSSSAQPSRPSSQPKAQQQSQPSSAQKFDSSDHDFNFTIHDVADGPRNESRERGLLDLDNDATEFNFGHREGQLDHGLGLSDSIDKQDISDHDDILGMLSQPVEVVKAQTQTQVNFLPFMITGLPLLLSFACASRIFVPIPPFAFTPNSITPTRP
jgi:hypothetical protein